MPLVIAALAPGFAGHETLQLAVTDARLMLPYLAFAGPATVLLALASAQGNFFLTAFSPLLFNIALITVMIALFIAPARNGPCRDGACGNRRRRGPLQLPVLVLRRGERVATPLRVTFDAEMRGFLRAPPRHGRELRAAIADRRWRHHRVLLTVGGIMALFRQPPDRAAARHRRRRHGNGADPGIDARAAGRRQAQRSRSANRARSSSRSDWRCPPRSD